MKKLTTQKTTLYMDNKTYERMQHLLDLYGQGMAALIRQLINEKFSALNSNIEMTTEKQNVVEF